MSDIVDGMTNDSIQWYMLDEQGEPVTFDQVLPEKNKIHFVKENYTPQKTSFMQKRVISS